MNVSDCPQPTPDGWCGCGDPAKHTDLVRYDTGGIGQAEMVVWQTVIRLVLILGGIAVGSIICRG